MWELINILFHTHFYPSAANPAIEVGGKPESAIDIYFFTFLTANVRYCTLLIDPMLVGRNLCNCFGFNTGSIDVAEINMYLLS